jgi:hypothetical protein
MRNRQYLTSKGNTLFSVKRPFSNENKVMKKGLPINSDEESYLVAAIGEISNFDLVKDLAEVVEYLNPKE